MFFGRKKQSPEGGSPASTSQPTTPAIDFGLKPTLPQGPSPVTIPTYTSNDDFGDDLAPGFDAAMASATSAPYSPPPAPVQAPVTVQASPSVSYGTLSDDTPSPLPVMPPPTAPSPVRQASLPPPTPAPVLPPEPVALPQAYVQPATAPVQPVWASPGSVASPTWQSPQPQPPSHNEDDAFHAWEAPGFDDEDEVTLAYALPQPQPYEASAPMVLEAPAPQWTPPEPTPQPAYEDPINNLPHVTTVNQGEDAPMVLAWPDAVTEPPADSPELTYTLSNVDDEDTFDTPNLLHDPEPTLQPYPPPPDVTQVTPVSDEGETWLAIPSQPAHPDPSAPPTYDDDFGQWQAPNFTDDGDEPATLIQLGDTPAEQSNVVPLFSQASAPTQDDWLTPLSDDEVALLHQLDAKEASTLPELMPSTTGLTQHEQRYVLQEAEALLSQSPEAFALPTTLADALPPVAPTTNPAVALVAAATSALQQPTVPTASSLAPETQALNLDEFRLEAIQVVQTLPLGTRHRLYLASCLTHTVLLGQTGTRIELLKLFDTNPLPLGQPIVATPLGSSPSRELIQVDLGAWQGCLVLDQGGIVISGS